VLDHLPATTLADPGRQRGPLRPAETAVVGLDVLAALRAVHRAGIVHCDVKPANLMVSADGTTVLVDFGIAQVAGAQRSGRDAGMVVGSPSYLAPELVRGEPSWPAADLWALGATLYRAVEGKAPFGQPDPASTLAAVLQDPPRPALRAGPLRPLLDRLLVKDPVRRASHEETADLLDAALTGAR
jgi:serine/threonine protein kinase